MAEDLFSVWNPLECDRRHATFESEYLPKGAPLSESQKEALIGLSHQTRINDLEYLNRHLEVRAIIRQFIHELTLECPLDVRKFCRKFFSRPKEELCRKIEKHVEDFKKIRRNVVAGDSPTASGSDSSKVSSCLSLKAAKCMSVTLSELLDLPKIATDAVETLEVPSTQSSSTSSETWDSSDFEHQKIEEGIEDEDYKCHDCHCLIKFD